MANSSFVRIEDIIVPKKVLRRVTIKLGYNHYAWKSRDDNANRNRNDKFEQTNHLDEKS